VSHPQVVILLIQFSDFGVLMARYGNFKQIAEGGQATIYLGVDELNRKVILKQVKHDNAGTCRRLQREARLLREQEGNAHVVGLIADRSDYHPPYIILEYCGGGSLASWVTNRHSEEDVGAVLSNRNTYDSKIQRYRNHKGQFASGIFG
jgi:serine/threonine protein kinase